MKSMFTRPASEYAAVLLSVFSVVSFLLIWFTH
ncbi:hypothetical protein Pat9b_5759 (plasmid) [Pantoea sp. At-9b]|jgi:hypothetical protein|nr:hypothetical protein Pat9b_5759 [Pantoea sp. At-9b]